MKLLLAASAILTLTAGAAMAQESAQQLTRHPQQISPQTTTGEGTIQPGYNDRPQSPVSASSGNVTHPDEQEKGLVPGNPNADGGEVRNKLN